MEIPDQGVESEADEDLLEYEVTVTAPDGTKIVSDGSPDEIVIENPHVLVAKRSGKKVQPNL